EGEEGNATAAVKRIPGTNRHEFVLISMAPRELLLVPLNDEPGQLRIPHGRKPPLDPAEDPTPRVLPDVPRRRRPSHLNNRCTMPGPPFRRPGSGLGP